jgi:hypothetical protein
MCSHGAWYTYVVKYLQKERYLRSDLMNLVPIDGLSAAEGLQIQSRFLESYENVEDEN